MDRVNGADHIDIGGGRRGFRDEDLGTGITGTEVTADWLNAIQEELMSLVEGAGMAGDPTKWDLVLKAIQSGRFNYVVAGGTPNALTLTLPVKPNAYYDGLRVSFKAVADSNDAVTLNINTLGPKPILPLPQLKGGKIYSVLFNSTADAWVFPENGLALKNVTRIKCESSGYAIANSLVTTLPLTSFADDGQADFTVSGNTIICARAGRYVVLGNFGVNSNPNLMYAATMGLRRASIDAFSSSLSMGAQYIYQNYGGGADILDIAVGDVFSLWGYQVSSGTLTLTLANRVAFLRQSN